MAGVRRGTRVAAFGPADEENLAGWVIESADIDCAAVLFLHAEGPPASTNGIWMLRAGDGRGYLMHWDHDGVCPRQIAAVISAVDPQRVESAVEALFVEGDGAWPSIAPSVAAAVAGELVAVRVSFNPRRRPAGVGTTLVR